MLQMSFSSGSGLEACRSGQHLRAHFGLDRDLGRTGQLRSPVAGNGNGRGSVASSILESRDCVGGAAARREADDHVCLRWNSGGHIRYAKVA